MLLNPLLDLRVVLFVVLHCSIGGSKSSRPSDLRKLLDYLLHAVLYLPVEEDLLGVELAQDFVDRDEDDFEVDRFCKSLVFYAAARPLQQSNLTVLAQQTEQRLKGQRRLAHLVGLAQHGNQRLLYLDSLFALL